MQFIDLRNKAVKEKQEEILLQRWIPYQSEISFNDFKIKLIDIQQTHQDSRTADEILNQVEEILRNATSGGDDL